MFQGIYGIYFQEAIYGIFISGWRMIMLERIMTFRMSAKMGIMIFALIPIAFKILLVFIAPELIEKESYVQISENKSVNVSYDFFNGIDQIEISTEGNILEITLKLITEKGESTVHVYEDEQCITSFFDNNFIASFTVNEDVEIVYLIFDNKKHSGSYHVIWK